MEHEEYLNKQILEDKDTYLDREFERIKKYKNKSMAEIFIDKLKAQNLCCYYCNTDIRIIQSLIMNHIIECRKRGKYGFSGMNFEIEHLDSENTNDLSENIAAVCYYCNNDKSNTIGSDIYKKHFGALKNKAFEELLKEHKLKPKSNYYLKNQTS